MKKIFVALLLSSMLASPLVANAADAAKTQQAESADKNTPVKQVAPNVSEFDKQMAQVQENVQKMHEQMEKIQQTRDPQERQKLLQDHWTTMQNGMQMMHGMWGSGMMGCCTGGMMMGYPMMGGHMMGWNDMGNYYSNLTSEQIKQRQYMTDQYMSMQQMMMDNMMQHQNWMMQPRGNQ